MGSGWIPRGELEIDDSEGSTMRTNASRTRSPVTLRDMSPYSGSFVLIMSSSLADKELDEGVVELIVVLIIERPLSV